jgi:hypothetical protein
MAWHALDSPLAAGHRMIQFLFGKFFLFLIDKFYKLTNYIFDLKKRKFQML